jgi:hypothetical protein
VEEERPSSPSLRSLSCQDLRLSGSTPGSYYPPLRLGWVVISWPLWAIVGSGVESIIDNYKRRSPAWSSFLCGPRGPDLLSTTCPPPTPKAAVTPRPSYATAATTKATRCAPWPSDRQDPIYTTPPATSLWAAKTRAGSRPPPASFRKADTHLKRVARIADYAFKAAALRGPQNEGPGSGDACGDGRSSRGVVATARDGASSVRAGRRWRTSFVSESLVRPPEPLEGPPRCCGGVAAHQEEVGVRGRACPAAQPIGAPRACGDRWRPRTAFRARNSGRRTPILKRVSR